MTYRRDAEGRTAQRRYYLRNRDKYRQWAKASRVRHHAKIKEDLKRYSWNRKVKVLMGYGGVCVCCKERDLHFLTIDHIIGGGSAHRRELGGTSSLYQWLIDNNFPPGFQVLCMNCNSAKQWYGGCPHDFPPDLEEYAREAETAL
jgi:aminoglycoside phosphotransferase